MNTTMCVGSQCGIMSLLVGGLGPCVTEVAHVCLLSVHSLANSRVGSDQEYRAILLYILNCGDKKKEQKKRKKKKKDGVNPKCIK